MYCQHSPYSSFMATVGSLCPAFMGCAASHAHMASHAGVSGFIRDVGEHAASTDWSDRTPSQEASLRTLLQTMRLSAPGLADGVDLAQRLIGQLVGRLMGRG